MIGRRLRLRGHEILYAGVRLQLVLKLRFVKLHVLTHLLTPGGFIVKINELARLSLSYGFGGVCPSKPSVILLMEHPVLPLKLNSGQILLIGPLLVVESEE
jgi:hypothetical protein